MKEEIIRFEHVTMRNGHDEVLSNVNFYMKKGEIMALIALGDLGKEEFLRLMSQNLPIDSGKIYYDGKQVNSYTRSDLSWNKVSIIQEKSGLIQSLSIADNIFVMRKGFRKYVINEKVLRNQTLRYLKDMGISICSNVRVDELSERERVIIEVVKAILSGHHLIIMDNISNFVNRSQNDAIFRLMEKLKQKGISFLYICNHHEEAFRIADRAMLYCDGRIQKILEKGELTEEKILPYIISFSSSKNNRALQNENNILVFRSVWYRHMAGLSFRLKRGECLTLMDLDNRAPSEIPRLLTGQEGPAAGTVEFDGEPYRQSKAVHFIESGIAVVPSKPIENYLFFEQSYMENLMFLLDRKIGRSVIRKAYTKSIRKEYGALTGPCIDCNNIMELDRKQLYSLVYYRVKLYHPKLAVLIQPVANGDMYCRKHILDLIQMLKESGISVLILTNSVSDNLTVSDRLVVIKKGKVTAEYQEEDYFAIEPPSKIIYNKDQQ